MEPMSTTMVCLPFLIAVIAGFKTPDNNIWFSLMVFIDLFLVGAFLFKTIGVKIVDKIIAKENSDERW